MKVEEKKIQNVKNLLNLKEEQMTRKNVEKIRKNLNEVEKKLQKWK